MQTFIPPANIELNISNQINSDIIWIQKKQLKGSFDYCFYENIMGKMMLASFGKRLCYVGFCNETTSHSEQTLIKLYKKEVIFNEESDIFKQTKVALDDYFLGKAKTFDLPLLLIGTPFQVFVWKILNYIPYGKTISYETQSLWLNNQRLIRAMASANGANPLSVILPCHRVIGKNGTLTGYAGGLELKEKLLIHEISFI